MIPAIGVSGACLLLALAAGYLVCCLAKKERGAIKALGYLVGIGIIAVTLLLILNGVAWKARVLCRYYKASRQGDMGMMKQGRGGMGMMMNDKNCQCCADCQCSEAKK